MWWHQGETHLPHLATIQQALWQDRQLHIVYRTAVSIQLERLVAPYGLVAKAGVWYLVCARGERIHVHRVAHLLDVQVAEDAFTYPAEFDLARYWQSWCAEYESLQAHFTATVRVAPGFVPELARRFGQQVHEKIAQAGPPNGDGWVQLELAFASFEDARDRILGFGRGVEVLAPQALHRSVLDYAEQIVDLYTD